jgi:hypothetical protein
VNFDSSDTERIEATPVCPAIKFMIVFILSVMHRTVPSVFLFNTLERSASLRLPELRDGRHITQKKGEGSGARWKFGMSIARIQRCQVAVMKHYMLLFNALCDMGGNVL